MKVDREVAQKEVESWLDYKKVSEKKRESQKDMIDALVDAISEGDLSLNAESKSFIHTLKFPTEGELSIKSLEYKPRLKMSTLHVHLQGVKASDADARMIGFVAALSGKPKEIIKSLDSEDYNVAQAIAVFFV